MQTRKKKLGRGSGAGSLIPPPIQISFQDTNTPDTQSWSFHALDQLFDQYLTPEDGMSKDRVGMAGMQKYLADLNISIDSFQFLILSHLVGSKSLGEMDRTSFVQGWLMWSAQSLEIQQTCVETLMSLVPVAFQQNQMEKIYQNTFQLGINGLHSRTMDLETAIEFWKLIFAQEDSVKWSTDKIDYGPLWIKFLEAEWGKGINRDIWNQTWRFARKTVETGSLSWWDESAAWPVILDEFVLWLRNSASDQAQS